MSDLLADLSDEQRAAATALDGPVLIVAGPGSGKTRTITHRIAHGVATGRYEAHRTLAVSFTSRAAGELHHRLVTLGAGDVAVRTFHSAALRQLRHFWADAVGGSVPRIAADRAPLLRTAAATAGLGDDSDTLAQLAAELDWCKARGVSVDAYPGGERPVAHPEKVAAALVAYEQAKSDRGVMDFDDVLLVTVALLETRSDIRESVRRAYRWFTVDEYQDVSPLQQRLLDLWVGDRGQVCVVGDPAQTIYEFAGADATLLRDFPRRHPGTTVVELSTTFRCGRAIAEIANRMAPAIPGALTLRSGAAEAGTTQVLQFPSAIAEAQGVADEIAALVRAGHPGPQIAVLCRTHQQGRGVQDALRRRGIPFSTRGGDRFFARAEVREAVTRLRGEVRQHPNVPAGQAMSQALAAMGHVPDPPDAPGQRDRWESLAALAALFDDGISGSDAVRDLDRRETENSAPPPAGVSLLTLHAAKGLEWDTVFVIGADDTQLPNARATTERQLDEERRLLYVGVTRPRRRLVVTWAATVHDSPVGPSRFLSSWATAARHEVRLPVELNPPTAAAALGAEGRAGAGLPPARCRWCGRALVTGAERVAGRCASHPDTADADLLAELLAWRDRVAGESGVPGHVVMTDATVHAIAELRPDDERQLGAIPGMRAERIERFGPAVLDLVRRRSGPRP